MRRAVDFSGEFASFDMRLSESLRAFPPDGRYLIGASGGRDSIALLHWLGTHGYKRLIVCHLDHSLRGRASSGDMLFSRRLAQQQHLEFETSRVDVKEYASTKKQSLESAGRAARLDFFASVARRRRCRTIFLAHHADDQVETFLMQLFRGAGSSGLGGMKPLSQIGSLQIVRPLLGIWRAEIDAYIAQHRLRYREDASNRDPTHLRNRIRHSILPTLAEEIGRDLRPQLWRTATILAEENDLLESLLPCQDRDTEELLTRELLPLPLPLQRRAVRRWLHRNEIADVGYDLIERVRGLLNPAGKTAKTNLPGGGHARRRAGRIFLE